MLDDVVIKLLNHSKLVRTQDLQILEVVLVVRDAGVNTADFDSGSLKLASLVLVANRERSDCLDDCCLFLENFHVFRVQEVYCSGETTSIAPSLLRFPFPFLRCAAPMMNSIPP